MLASPHVRRVALWLALGLGPHPACTPSDGGPLVREGTLRGSAALGAGARGDVWLFLYGRSEAPPEGAGRPRYVSTIPDVRLARGEAGYVFGQVQPNPYRLVSFLDVDRSFASDLDVLGQPGAGDRLGGAVDLNLQPGEALARDVTIQTPVVHEPPAFRLGGAAPEVVELPDSPVVPVWLELQAEAVAGLSPGATAFRVSLADADQDGQPDDDDRDGVPDLYPRVLLRFLRRPGQVVPTDGRGQPVEVVVPLLFNPGPFLANLGGRIDAELAVDRLQVFVIPQAQGVSEAPGRGRVVQPLDAIPVGEYQLVLLSRSGQSWWLPNDLATHAAQRVGGPYPTQAVRFRVVHGTGLDAGR